MLLIVVFVFAKKRRSNVRLVKKKCSNHPDWATGRPSGSPLAALIIFDLFFLSLDNNQNWILTITFYRTSSYPKVRSPPSSNRYLGLFARTCQYLVIHCKKVNIGVVNITPTLKYMLERYPEPNQVYFTPRFFGEWTTPWIALKRDIEIQNLCSIAFGG